MSRFQNVLAEAAHAVCNHGCGEEEFGSTGDTGGWNALAVVSGTILMNLDEADLWERYVNEQGDPPGDPSGWLVWINEGEQGDVFEIMRGHDGGLGSGTDLVNRAFDKMMEAMS